MAARGDIVLIKRIINIFVGHMLQRVYRSD